VTVILQTYCFRSSAIFPTNLIDFAMFSTFFTRIVLEIYYDADDFSLDSPVMYGKEIVLLIFSH
jgi:hypothetical protein